jgi:hypothetical protein
MADLVKGVLGGAWSLVIGWILPAFLFLQFIVGVLLPDFRQIDAVKRFLGQTVATQQAAMLVCGSRGARPGRRSGAFVPSA